MTRATALRTIGDHVFRRQFFQADLRSLLGLMTLICVGLAIVAGRAERQRRAVALLRSSGAEVNYEERPAAAAEGFTRRTLRQWLPRDYMDDVIYVGLANARATPTELALLPRLSRLEWLELDGAPVTDATLARLVRLKALREIDLSSTQVTDLGLRHVSRLKNLEELALTDTRVTDAGLPHLKELKGLRALFLIQTDVTQAGIDDLRQTLPGCVIYH
jgi:hypothetical protein